MQIKNLCYLIALVILSGCTSSEDKIVDLSAVVFCLYVTMIAVKYFSPIVVDSSFFANIAKFIQAHLKSVVIPVYLISLSLFVIGFYLSGIHRIFIFIGLSLAVIGHHLGKLVRSDQNEGRELSIEIVSLGIGIVVVQVMMWHFGPELFEPF
ncbi:hypothetical protein OAF61_00685 [Pseudomonadales bacterium]|nr:hypothetical protein [Pseudomonadales bacterium]